MTEENRQDPTDENSESLAAESDAASSEQGTNADLSGEISGDEIPIGIDLGTTYSAIAYIDKNGEVKIIKVDRGSTTLASAVDYAPDGVEVGAIALRRYLTHNDRVVRWIKRSMGEEDHTVTVRTGTGADDVSRLTPEEVSAEILKSIVADASKHLGRPITKVVVTCPAWFDARAREATAKATELAGLELIRIIEEPTAAALYWGLENLKNALEEARGRDADDAELTRLSTLLAYDLGGGTFDCTIMRYDEETGKLKRVMSEGRRELGGHDWTKVLVEKCCEKCQEAFGENPGNSTEFRTDLYEKCERAKRQLSTAPSQKIVCNYKKTKEIDVTAEEIAAWKEAASDPGEALKDMVATLARRASEMFDIDMLASDETRQLLEQQCEQALSDPESNAITTITCAEPEMMTTEIEVTQAEFEEWTEELLQLTLMSTEEAINMANLSWYDIGHVLLVGSSTKLRRVPEALRELSNLEPIRTGDEETMVALGAAMVAANVLKTNSASTEGDDEHPGDGGITEEHAQRHMGIVTVDRSGRSRTKNEVIIEKGSALPAEGTRNFPTVVANQKFFKIPVVEIEDVDDDFVIPFMTYRFDCLPDTPQGSQIEVTFRYDESNRIQVDAKDVRTDQVLQGIMDQYVVAGPEDGSSTSVDLCFVVDATMSMGGCIHGVKQQITQFCNTMAEKGLPYRLGLVVFRDLKIGEKHVIHEWTEEVSEFRGWVENVHASGGGDIPESALDGLVAASELPVREGVQRVAFLITDAPCHVPDQGGRSAKDVAQLLSGQGMKVVAIAPAIPKDIEHVPLYLKRFQEGIEAYEEVIVGTGGEVDIKDDSDSDLLDFYKYFNVGAVDIPLFQQKLQQLGGKVIDDTLLGSVSDS